MVDPASSPRGIVAVASESGMCEEIAVSLD
jgi:hypothetical protein